MANVVTETFKLTVSRTLQYFYRYIDAARALQQIWLWGKCFFGRRRRQVCFSIHWNDDDTVTHDHLPICVYEWYFVLESVVCER